MSVLDYYKKSSFNPVPIKFAGKSNIKTHYLKRINLLENHLKIYLPFLNNRDVLEFGCNGAENACLLSEYGANLYLVEPHKKMHKVIINNFNKIKKKNKLKLLSDDTLEDFRSKKKFDIIIAEGFLNTLKKRNLYFKKISKLLAPGGLLIINYDDIYGGFFEYLKSYMLIKLCKKKNINTNSKESLNLAETLFKKEFDKLNKSRSFKAWWKDQLINPYASKTWSLLDLVKLANNQKSICQSTSPIFYNLNFLKWYKDINLVDFKFSNSNKLYCEIWKKNFLNFFIGSSQKTKQHINDKTLVKLKNFIKKMNLCFENKSLNKSLYIPKELKSLLKNNDLYDYYKEIDRLINLLNSKSQNTQKIINYYRKSKKVKNTWGSLLHYIVFKKNVIL